MSGETLAERTSGRRLHLAEVLDALVDDGLLAAEQVELIKRLSDDRRHPLVAVAERRLSNAALPGQVLRLEFLTQWLARRVGLPYRRIDPLAVDVPTVTQVMSYAYARRFRILALEVTRDRVMVATAEPFVDEWRRELERLSQREVVAALANPEEIERYLLEFYSLSRSVFQAGRQHGAPIPGVQNLEQLTELGRAGKLDANDRHVVGIVDWLLQYACEQRASDIHLEPRRDVANVRFRIDGVLHLVYQLPPSVMAAVTSRVKILGRMNPAERRRPQDGRIKILTRDEQEVELRLSTMPTAFGEKLVLRLFEPDSLVRDFRALGFGARDQEQWLRLTRRPHGILLVTGPTGSGKTTTLYSSLKSVAGPEVNVCTIEDPIEMVESAFNQTQVQPAIGLDFAAGVRTLLRQDPDVVMVGEIRDRETAEMAVQAALTGHLVFSTLHTNDAPSAVARLLEIGVPAYLIRATLLGALAQRLVRVLCPHCKQPAAVDPERWAELVAPWRLPPPAHTYRPEGCLECRQTGYLGRIGIYELMEIGPELGALVSDGVDARSLRRQAIAGGLRPMRLNGAQKVAEGLTSIEEVLRVAPG